MTTLQRAARYAFPYKNSFSLGVFFNLLYAIFNVVALSTMMPVLSILFDEKSVKVISEPKYSDYQGFEGLKEYLSLSVDYTLQSWVSQWGENQTLLIACGFFLLAFLLRNIFSYFSEYFLINLRTGVSVDLRKEIHDKILSLPVSYFTEKRKGDVVTRITSDVSIVEGSILNSLVEFVRSPIVIVVSFVSLFLMSPELTVFTIVVFPIMGTIISYIGKSLKKNAGYAQRSFESLLSYLDETLVASKIIKIFNAEKQIQNRFDSTLEQYRKFLVKVEKKKALASPTSEFLGGITIALLVYFGGTLSLEGNGLNGSAFVTYIGLFYTMLDPIKKFSKSLSEVQKGQVSAQRIFELLDTHIAIKDEVNALSKNGFENEIEFKNVWFQYNSDEADVWVIKDFSLRLPKGKNVALVGQSGSGKSTIANLLTRFYDVSKGEILIDGVNIKDIKLKDYRSLFGMVTQDSILFNDTIANNVSLGAMKPEERDIAKSIEISNAKEFVDKLDGGLSYQVGEAGGKLSGGQKQRVSIARAVFKNPPIMVLDEATSALDTQSEKWVQDALEQMMQNRTSLIIAHRLSTVMNADEIIVMNDGEIVERGTHNSLLENDGNYAQLVKLQNLQ